MSEHNCGNSDYSIHHVDTSWWVNDARGIPLCKVCNQCKKERLSRYRPEILSGYDQSDVDEPIEEED